MLKKMLTVVMLLFLNVEKDIDENFGNFLCLKFPLESLQSVSHQVWVISEKKKIGGGGGGGADWRPRVTYFT